VFYKCYGEAGVLVPRFLGFEVKLVPSHVGGLGFDLVRGYGGDLGFGREGVCGPRGCCPGVGCDS
jgi:hypothetical protein